MVCVRGEVTCVPVVQSNDVEAAAVDYSPPRLAAEDIILAEGQKELRFPLTIGTRFQRAVCVRERASVCDLKRLMGFH